MTTLAALREQALQQPLHPGDPAPAARLLQVGGERWAVIITVDQGTDETVWHASVSQRSPTGAPVPVRLWDTHTLRGAKVLCIGALAGVGAAAADPWEQGGNALHYRRALTAAELAQLS